MIAEREKRERQSANVTDQMYADCQVKYRLVFHIIFLNISIFRTCSKCSASPGLSHPRKRKLNALFSMTQAKNFWISSICFFKNLASFSGLTDGTITDDSDILVFGGRVVYKNFFNQEKHCENYVSNEIAKHLGKCKSLCSI